MLLFKNKEKRTYFGVDQHRNRVVFAPASAARWLIYDMRYTEILVLPDYKTVQQFRKLIEKGVVANLPDDEARLKLINEYPELFI